MTRRPITRLGVVVVVMLLAPVATPAQSADDPFPTFESIEGHVSFWTSVWGEWSMGQVAVHHIDHPVLVFEVADIPGRVQEAYSREQIEWIKDLRTSWEDRLEELAERIEAGETLDNDDKALALRITTSVGTDAVLNAHKRVRTQRGLRERFKRGIEISFSYDVAFRRTFGDAGLPEDLAYLPHVESSFQARARSSAGAVGIWQFTRGTGRKFMKITSAIDERLDPIIAAGGAAAYLTEAYEILGSWPIALTAYNHGVGGMSKAVKEFGPDYERIFNEYESRSFGFASKNFYAEFLAARAIAQDPQRYFPEGLSPEPERNLSRVELDRRASPAAIAQAYNVPLAELADINPAWTDRAVRSGLALPVGATAWLPANTLARLEADGLKPDLSGFDFEGVYIVRRGDNLSKIAAAYNMTLAELREMNDMARNEHTLHVGQRLKVALQAGPAIHVVRRGDTLSDIAQQYDMSVGDLRSLNGIPRTSNLIRAGQKLTVSGGAANQVHVVRRGDTLSGIASRYGMTLAELRQANGLSRRSSLIRAGQRLTVFGARGTAAQSRYHVVSRGETLSHISIRYRVRLTDLLRTNGLSLSSLIHPGQRLQIPVGI